MNCLFVDENIPLLADALQTIAKVVKFKGRLLTNQQLIDENCNALFVRSTTKVNQELINNTKICFVGTATSGTDHIDTAYLTQNNIKFIDAPGSNANSVAEYVVYSMLKWSNIIDTPLANKTVGIIGYGNVGKLVAKYSHLLKLNILVNDPPLKDTGYVFPENVNYTDLETIFDNCDIITNHVPLIINSLYPSFNLITSNNLQRIKTNSLIVHASRGKVINEKDLLEYKHKKNLYLAIDVWENEPAINPILAQSTILSTPHIAGYSRDGKIRGSYKLANEYKIFSNSNPNLEVYSKELNHYTELNQDEYNNEKLIYQLLKSNRDFDTDNEKFIQTLVLAEEERPKYFDNMRKQYPERWETL